MSISDLPPSDADTNRRELLRAGLVGATGLGLIATANRPVSARMLSSGTETCPVWFMGYSTDGQGDTLFDYYSYQFPDGCGAPDLSTGSMIVSTSALTCGCGSPSCGQRIPFAPRKTQPDVADAANVDIPIHFEQGGLPKAGITTGYINKWAYPLVDVSYDCLHHVNTTAGNVLVRLMAVKFSFMLGGKLQKPALIAFGREVDPQNPPNGPPMKEDLKPEPPQGANQNRYRVVRHVVMDADFSKGNVGFHTLFKTDLGGC